MEMKKIMSSMLAATMVAGMAVTPIVGEKIFGGAVVVAEAGETGDITDKEQAAPQGLQGVAPTTSDNNDGKITGTTVEMEYKLSTAEDKDYADCLADTTTGLAAATYDVRLKAKEGFKAGTPAQVEVAAYVKPQEKTYEVTFKAAEKAEALDNATIKVYSDKDKKTEVKDYSKVKAGTYYYTIIKKGFEEKTGSFEVTDSAKDVEITLVATKEDKPAKTTSSHKKSKRSSSNTTSADKVGSSVSNPTPSVKEADANKAVEKALEAAVKVGDKEAKAEVVFENVKEVAPDVFKAIADKAAKQNGVDLSIKVHMDSVENGKTTARMYINPQLAMALKNPVNTLISTSSNNADNAKTTATFTKYFKNETAVVSFDQKGDFGMKISAAVKVDLAKLNTKALKFYSYDTAKNTYKLLADTNQFVDVNGYLHFDTVVGNTVVITDSPLESK